MARGEDLIEIIAVVGFIAILGAGLILGLDAMEGASYDDVDVDNETFNATTDPYNYTVSVSGNAGYVEIEQAQAYNTTSQTTELTTDIVNSTTVEVSGSAGHTGSQSLDYTYSEESDASDFVSSSINAFDVVPGLLEVIVVFGFVAVLIGLLWMAMGRMGLGRRMRGGM